MIVVVRSSSGSSNSSLLFRLSLVGLWRVTEPLEVELKLSPANSFDQTCNQALTFLKVRLVVDCIQKGASVC